MSTSMSRKSFKTECAALLIKVQILPPKAQGKRAFIERSVQRLHDKHLELTEKFGHAKDVNHRIWAKQANPALHLKPTAQLMPNTEGALLEFYDRLHADARRRHSDRRSAVKENLRRLQMAQDEDSVHADAIKRKAWRLEDVDAVFERVYSPPPKAFKIRLHDREDDYYASPAKSEFSFFSQAEAQGITITPSTLPARRGGMFYNSSGFTDDEEEEELPHHSHHHRHHHGRHADGPQSARQAKRSEQEPAHRHHHHHHHQQYQLETPRDESPGGWSSGSGSPRPSASRSSPRQLGSVAKRSSPSLRGFPGDEPAGPPSRLSQQQVRKSQSTPDVRKSRSSQRQEVDLAASKPSSRKSGVPQRR